jgi:hypothetical protein
MSKHAIQAAIFSVAALASASASAANFFEGFDGTGGAGTAWETANWANGDIFGCTFAYSEVWRTGSGNLQLNVKAQYAFQGATSTLRRDGRRALPRRRTLWTNSKNPR